jgi:PhnB protein
MQLNSYLVFDGKAREALTFYHRCLGGEIASMMSFGEMPGCDDMPAGAEDRLAHGTLAIDGHLLMVSDTMPGQPYEGIKCGSFGAPWMINCGKDLGGENTDNGGTAA